MPVGEPKIMGVVFSASSTCHRSNAETRSVGNVYASIGTAAISTRSKRLVTDDIIVAALGGKAGSRDVVIGNLYLITLGYGRVASFFRAVQLGVHSPQALTPTFRDRSLYNI
jgi:hypothetical protein